MIRLKSSRLLGYIIQAVTIYLGINIVYGGYMLIGLFVALGSLFINVALKSANVKKDALKTAFKLLLLGFGIAIWMIFVSGNKLSKLPHGRGDATLYTRTHNIITPDSRSHSYRVKNSVKRAATSIKAVTHKASNVHSNTDITAIANTNADIPEKGQKSIDRKKKVKRKYVVRKEFHDDIENYRDKKIDIEDTNMDKNKGSIALDSINDKSSALLTETFGKLFN